MSRLVLLMLLGGTANDSMKSLQVQSAGAMAPTLPASTVLSGTPTGDDSFARTFGRALESVPGSVQDGSSIAPQESQASPRGKGNVDSNSDTPSVVGTPNNCFVTNILHPPPTVAPSTETPGPTVSLQGREPTLGSPPNYVSSLNAAASATGTNTETMLIRAALRGVAAFGTLSARVGNSVGAMATPKAEGPKATAGDRGHVAIQSGVLVPITGENQSDDAAIAQTTSAPAWFPEAQETSPLTQPVAPQFVVLLSESKQAEATDRGSAQKSGHRKEPLTSPSFMNSWPLLEQLDPAQTQGTPSPRLRATSPSTLLSATDQPDLAEFSSLPGMFAGAEIQALSTPMLRGQGEQAALTFSPEARNSSTPFSASGHPELAGYSSLPGRSAGAGVPATSHPTRSGGQTGQATFASGSKASDNSGPEVGSSAAPINDTDRLGLPEFSSSPGKLAGTEVQAASNHTLPKGQMGQAAPTVRPKASDSSTPIYVSDRPDRTEFSSLQDKFVGAGVHAGSNPTLSGGETEQYVAASIPKASDASLPEAGDSPTPIYVTDHTDLAEFSSLLGKFVGAEVQAVSNPMFSGGRTEESPPTSSLKASDISTPEASGSSTPPSAPDPPAAAAEFSSLTGEFTGADLVAESNTTPYAGQVGQDAVGVRPVQRDSSPPVSPTSPPELAGLSALLEKHSDGQIDARFSKNVPQPTTASDNFTKMSTSVAANTLFGGLHTSGVDAAQVPAVSKPYILVDTPGTGNLHSAQVSSRIAVEAAWQTGNMSEAPSATAPLSSDASPVPSPPLEADSQPVPPATAWQKDAPPEANSVPPSGAVSADSGGGTAHANLSDSPTSGQGKPGQQSGSAPGNNQPDVRTLAPTIANNPTADSTADLFTAHTPNIPLSHANAPTPQTAPSPSHPATTLSAWQNYEGGAGKIVRSAWLSDSANGAEMHVELRTGALGPLDVHAVVHEGTVGAEIHVQGQEAHSLLAAGLPSLERALGERNLRVENINIYQDQGGGGTSGGGKQDSQSGSSSPQRQVLPWDNHPHASNTANGSSDDEELANPASGLSVQA